VADEARRRGHDPDEAVRLARLEAGGTAQAMEAMRDQRGLPWLDDMARDVSYGLRTLRRNRGFAVTAMLSLALGIGANTGIFSLVDQLLLRRLPVSAPDRLVMFDWRGPSLPSVSMGLGNPMSYPLCLDLQAQDRYFDGVFCRAAGELNFSTGQQYEVVRSESIECDRWSCHGPARSPSRWRPPRREAVTATPTPGSTDWPTRQPSQW
jgi:hypothetical protein